MKATHRSRWLSRSVSGLSSAGTNRRRRPSIPAPDLKSGSSESTVSTAVMPASLRWSGSAAAAAPPRYSGLPKNKEKERKQKVNIQDTREIPVIRFVSLRQFTDVFVNYKRQSYQQLNLQKPLDCRLEPQHHFPLHSDVGTKARRKWQGDL
uniref:Uncharacterized protein n=1 Tax=Felis catus TaxID=9685 RepID=A0ABI7X3A4_FELCA